MHTDVTHSRPGYSNIGTVIEVGKSVTSCQVGERVASTQGHTSHFVTSPNRLRKVTSTDAPAEEAVFFNLGAIALQGIRKARIELGEATLILGQGTHRAAGDATRETQWRAPPGYRCRSHPIAVSNSLKVWERTATLNPEDC